MSSITQISRNLKMYYNAMIKNKNLCDFFPPFLKISDTLNTNRYKMVRKSPLASKILLKLPRRPRQEYLSSTVIDYLPCFAFFDLIIFM